jgi:hypothetical protein
MALMQRPPRSLPPKMIPRLALLLIYLTVWLSGQAWAATLEVGAGKTYGLPSVAAGTARDGDHIAIAARSYSDCAVWNVIT